MDTCSVCFHAKAKEELEQEASSYLKYDRLVSSLPRTSQSRVQHSQFNGFWFPNDEAFGLKAIHSIMAARDHFSSRPDDVLLATPPKAGTTWLKALAFATLNRDGHPYPQSTLLSLSPHQCVPFLEHHLYTGSRMPDLDALPSPRLLATHIPYSLLPGPALESETCKIVYLSRNPKDTLVSLWKFADSFAPTSLDRMFQAFVSGEHASGPFWDSVLEYWKASAAAPDKVLFVKYEDLKREPAAQLSRLAAFMGCPFSREEAEAGVVGKILKLCSFESLRGLGVNRAGSTSVSGVKVDNSRYFRKGEVGDWINHLTPAMSDKLDQVTMEKFHGTGLSFE